MITKQINNYTRSVSFDRKKIIKAGFFLSDMLTPKQWYDRQTDKPTFVCNAPFFTWSNELNKFIPCHTLKIDGQILRQESLYRGLGIKGTDFSIGDISSLDCDDFISGKPVITEGNENMVTQGWINTLSDVAGYEPRTVIGFNENEFIALMVDGRQPGKYGINLEQLPKLCLDNRLENSVNLDGGYSSMSILNGEIFNSPDLSKARGTVAVFALWEEQEMIEWKEPNWSWVTLEYAQVDKDGNIKHQNSVYSYAYGSCKKNGWAVWQKSTKKRLYPEHAINYETETEKPMIDLTQLKKLATNLETRTIQLKTALDELLNHLKELEK